MAMPIKSSSLFLFPGKKHNKIAVGRDVRRAGNNTILFSEFIYLFIHIFLHALSLSNLSQYLLSHFRSIEFDKHSNITGAGGSDASRCHFICHRLHCIGNGVPEAGQQVCAHRFSHFHLRIEMEIAIAMIQMSSPQFSIQQTNLFRPFSSSPRTVEENLKSTKHTQLPAMAAECQIEQKQPHTRTTTPQLSGLATSMGNNCTAVNNNDTRHHQIISDQEPPDGDETDPDVIPNQYGKFHPTAPSHPSLA